MTREEKDDLLRFEKMRGQWKRDGDFVRASTRIINHRSNAHFGWWTRQMWFKINIKNPFPLRNRVPSHILSAAEVMAPGVHARMRERKKQICKRQRKRLQNDSQFYALSPFLSFDVTTESSKDKWLSFFFTDMDNIEQNSQNVPMTIINFMNFWKMWFDVAFTKIKRK